MVYTEISLEVTLVLISLPTPTCDYMSCYRFPWEDNKGQQDMWVLPVWRGWEDQTHLCGQWTLDLIYLVFAVCLYLFRLIIGLQVQNPDGMSIAVTTHWWCKRRAPGAAAGDYTVRNFVGVIEDSSWMVNGSLQRAMEIFGQQKLIAKSNKSLVISWLYRHVFYLSHRLAPDFTILKFKAPFFLFVYHHRCWSETIFLVVVFQSLNQQLWRATHVTGYQPGIQMGNASNYT